MQIQPVDTNLSKDTKPNSNGLNFPLGLNENIYHEGNISIMPDFDVFSSLEFRKRTARSHAMKKNGKCKRNSRVQNLANCTLSDLAEILDVHGRHRMLSYLSSLPISVLRSLDTEANKFYDRSNRLYDAALLTTCYTQHALRPVIDSKINHVRHYIKIPFINKGMEFIDLHVHSEINRYQSAISNYFKNCEVPVICYKYNKSIRSAIFNFNILFLILISKLVPLIPETVRTKYVYPAAGHVITGNLKIISDSRIRSIFAKSPKYRFPAKIDFQSCRDKNAAPLNEYCNRWCKREHVECDALKD